MPIPGCGTASFPGVVQVTVCGGGATWSVTWWYPDGRTITRIGDVTVVDPGDDGAHPDPALSGESI